HDNENEDEGWIELKSYKENMFTKLQEIKSGFYNRPFKKNLESIDSLLPNDYEPDHTHQMTIGNHHPVKVIKVARISSYRSQNSLVFCCPPDKFEEFSYQKYVTTTGGEFIGWNKSNDWILKNIVQYVLKIDLKVEVSKHKMEDEDIEVGNKSFKK
ncbi:20745_t:CDS:2, partial [Funneliformis geosporum]